MSRAVARIAAQVVPSVGVARAGLRRPRGTAEGQSGRGCPLAGWREGGQL